jgi:hypothetical protein
MTRERFNQGSSGSITGTITDAAGQAVPASSLTASTLTLYDLETYEPGASPMVGIINSREGQDVLNAHDVEIDSGGVFTWSVQPEDNAIVNTRRQVERHRALLHFEWDGGEFNEQVEIEVVNLRVGA